MKSKFFLAVFIAAVTFTVTQSGKANAQSSLLPDETMVDCEPNSQTVCVTINSVIYYGTPKTP